MGRIRRTRSPWWVLILTFLIGGLLGSVIAEALSAYPSLAPLTRDLRVAIIDPPFTFDARVLTFTLGLTLRLNLSIVIGWFLALWLFRLLV